MYVAKKYQRGFLTLPVKLRGWISPHAGGSVERINYIVRFWRMRGVSKLVNAVSNATPETQPFLNHIGVWGVRK